MARDGNAGCGNPQDTDQMYILSEVALPLPMLPGATDKLRMLEASNITRPNPRVLADPQHLDQGIPSRPIHVCTARIKVAARVDP